MPAFATGANLCQADCKGWLGAGGRALILYCRAIWQHVTDLGQALSVNMWA
jgi:hypothetical protein